MIYSFLKILMRLVLKVYFRKQHISGLENIPKEGPFIIVANHPSSFLDPISIAVIINKKINFLAKATLFKNRVAAIILKNLNLIPIYRAQDNPKKLKENNAVFKACYKKLGNKGVIMIFPEGTSENERRLRPIKTGAARIALGTAKENNYRLNIKILPVGLNYTNSSKFRSELSIEFGKVIDTDNYVHSFKNDETKTTRDLTTNIENRIKQLIINIEKQEHDELVQKIETIYKTELTPNSNLPIDISQEIVSEIHYYQKENPFFFNTIKYKIDNYFEKLNQAKISDKKIGLNTKKQSLLTITLISVFKLILGLPIWLIGFTHSFIPYNLTKIIALKITKDQAFYGALLMSIGAFLFIFFYSLSVMGAWIIFKIKLLSIFHLISLPFIGLFTISYSRFARKFYYNWKFYTSFYSRKQFILQLIIERKNIITELETLRKALKK